MNRLLTMPIWLLAVLSVLWGGTGTAQAATLPLLAQTTGIAWGNFIWDILLVAVFFGLALFVICRSSRRV